MAKKAAPPPAGPKKASKAATGRKRENVIQRVAEELEARFFEGAEMATETTSAETNVALAALGAIEGPRDAPPQAGRKAEHGKRKTTQPKTR
jgi:hypothetical protein